MNVSNEEILKQAGQLYNVRAANANTMGNSGNKIFEVKTDHESFILRASEYSQKNKEHIAFELQWIDYLSDTLDSIVKPVKSVNDNHYEIIHTDNKDYILCLFEKAHGKIIDSNNPEEFNEDIFFSLGALMGNMHKLTVKYEGNIINPEFEWDNDEFSWRKNYPILDEDVRLHERKYYNYIRALPKSKDSYGIIHYDIHTDNFFVENNKIKLFDFYDCQFNWYAADIASAVFFMVQKGAGPLKHKSEKERTEFAEAYLISYLKGYLQTNLMPEYWIDKINLFMKYQMTDEYRAAQSYRSDELLHLRQWYLNWHKDRIINDLPYVYIDYKKVINSIPPIYIV